MSTRVTEFVTAALLVGFIAVGAWWVVNGGDEDQRFDPDAAPPVYLEVTECSGGGKTEHLVGVMPDPLVWGTSECTTTYETNPEYLGWVEKQKWLTEEEKERAAEDAAEEY